jgi:hypothetical protein
LSSSRLEKQCLKKKDFSHLSHVHMQALLFDGTDAPRSAKKRHILYCFSVGAIFPGRLGEEITQE